MCYGQVQSKLSQKDLIYEKTGKDFFASSCICVRFDWQQGSGGHDPFDSLFFGCQTRVWRPGLQDPALKVSAAALAEAGVRRLGGSVRISSRS